MFDSNLKFIETGNWCFVSITYTDNNKTFSNLGIKNNDIVPSKMLGTINKTKFIALHINEKPVIVSDESLDTYISFEGRLNGKGFLKSDLKTKALKYLHENPIELDNKTFAYSENNETYTGEYNSILEAAYSAYANECTEFWIGECEAINVEDTFPDGQDIIEHMSCQTDHLFEINEFPDVSDEEVNALTTALRETLTNWCNECKINSPGYIIKNVSKYCASLDDGVFNAKRASS